MSVSAYQHNVFKALKFHVVTTFNNLTEKKENWSTYGQSNFSSFVIKKFLILIKTNSFSSNLNTVSLTVMFI